MDSFAPFFNFIGSENKQANLYLEFMLIQCEFEFLFGFGVTLKHI